MPAVPVWLGEQCRSPSAAGQGVGAAWLGREERCSQSSGVCGTEETWLRRRPGEEEEEEESGVIEGRVLPYSPGAGVTHRGMGGCSCCAAEAKLAALPRSARSPASLSVSVSLPPSLLLFLLLLPSHSAAEAVQAAQPRLRWRCAAPGPGPRRQPRREDAAGRSARALSRPSGRASGSTAPRVTLQGGE